MGDLHHEIEAAGFGEPRAELLRAVGLDRLAHPLDGSERRQHAGRREEAGRGRPGADHLGAQQLEQPGAQRRRGAVDQLGDVTGTLLIDGERDGGEHRGHDIHVRRVDSIVPDPLGDAAGRCRDDRRRDARERLDCRSGITCPALGRTRPPSLYGASHHYQPLGIQPHDRIT